MIKILRKNLLSGAHQARGIAIIIDVFRAFTCSTILFNYGLKKLIMFDQPERVLKFKNKFGGISIGEVNGRKFPGFDVGNSPSEIIKLGHKIFNNTTAVMHTSAGVHGVLAALENCEQVFLGSYLNARAITSYIGAKKNSQNQTVTLVAMGMRGEIKTLDDECCANYFEHLIVGSPYDHLQAINDILNDPYIRAYLHGTLDYFPQEDVVFCLQRDICSNILVASKEDGLAVVSDLSREHL